MLVSLFSCSISYTVNGSPINYDIIKTIRVQDFQNQAQLVYPPLTQVFNQQLKTRFIEQTRLRTVSNNPDIELAGEITGYDVVGTAVKEDAYASQTRLIITVKVRYTNNKQPEKSFTDQTFSASQEFPSSQSLDEVQNSLIQLIVKDLVDMIYNGTVGDW